MKIGQLLSGLKVILTNEEREFFERHDRVKLDSLNEHDKWLAQNLVRKGLYSISNDNITLKKQ